jgi:histidinol-phosphatase (PHP family)
VLDYHLHLWPHGSRAHAPDLGELAAYCERAAAAGISEIALTEHFFRFAQAADVVGPWWSACGAPSELRDQMGAYWSSHVSADLDEYVGAVLEAKAAGLPVVLGLEVDYYPGLMDKVGALLAEYPFDVLLGSVHWMGAWGFDNLDDPVAMAEWDRRSVEDVWRSYVEALEELAASGACDVLAHPDLCKVTGRLPAPSLVDEFHDRMAEAAASSGMAAEVSSAGWRKPVGEAYPAESLLARFCRRGVPVTTASDAHGLSDVGFRSAELRALVADAGYTALAAFRQRRPVEVAL